MSLAKLRKAIATVENEAKALGCTALISLHARGLPEAFEGLPHHNMLLTCHGDHHDAQFSIPITNSVPCIVAHEATPLELADLPHPKSIACQGVA